jgi:hypothetical protein
MLALIGRHPGGAGVAKWGVCVFHEGTRNGPATDFVMAGPRFAGCGKKVIEFQVVLRFQQGPARAGAFFRPHCDDVVTAAMIDVNVGVMGVLMAKNTKTKPVGSRKPAARARAAKKRSRRVIFKSDQWYAGAAMSIGIAGRAKGSRPVQLFMQRVPEKAEAD